MRHFALILSFVVAVPVAAAEPGVTSFTLDNGLTGVVIEDRRAPVVTQMLWYKVGSADEVAGQWGVAHFLEHLMFKGTATVDEGAFSRIVAENGGSDNAFTSTDYTAYYQRIASDRLDLVMGLEADRMAGITPTESAVASERDVVLEERRQVVESAPGGPFSEHMDAALYLNHPYGRPVIGWEHEIAALDRDTALAFHALHYAPNNAILVVAGDVDPAEVEALAKKHFGPIPGAAIPPRLRPQEPPHRAARRLEMRDPRVSEASLSRIYLAPMRRPGDQRAAAALAVLAEVLGGSGATSVLARELVLGQAIALDAGAFYSDTGVDVQSFGVYVTPQAGVDPAAAEAALDAALARFIATEPDAAALERVKRRIRAGEIYALDDQQQRARDIGASLASGLTLEDVEQWPGILQSVTVEDVRAAAEAVFRPENSVTGWLLGPEPDAGLAQ